MEIDDRDGGQNELLAVVLRYNIGRWVGVGSSGGYMSMLYVTEKFIPFSAGFTDSLLLSCFYNEQFN